MPPPPLSIEFNTVAASTLGPAFGVASDDVRVRQLLDQANFFFHRDTALNLGLDSAHDRFFVARDAMSSGIPVQPGTLTLIDGIHNWQITISLGAFSEHEFSIVPYILEHFGLAYPDGERVVRGKIRALPWFANATPIFGAQTLVLGHWVTPDPIRALEHAREMGVESSERWFPQTDGVLCWIRDAADGIAYEVDEDILERGIRVLDILRLPELKNMPGELGNSYTPRAADESYARPI